MEKYTIQTNVVIGALYKYYPDHTGELETGVIQFCLYDEDIKRKMTFKKKDTATNSNILKSLKEDHPLGRLLAFNYTECPEDPWKDRIWMVCLIEEVPIDLLKKKLDKRQKDIPWINRLLGELEAK